MPTELFNLLSIIVAVVTIYYMVKTSNRKAMQELALDVKEFEELKGRVDKLESQVQWQDSALTKALEDVKKTVASIEHKVDKCFKPIGG